ncbi:MAG TPA: hypothetical protein VHE56_10180, partial [Mycobacteriales bacterium]|nr:hypothetical protein [Mycobacteriales bacterium]
ANPPERWRTVATFAYGKRADQLGPPGGAKGVSGPNGAAGGAEPFPPAAIVVAGNTLWVLDQNKHRVAHFTLSGRYLGEVRGISPTAEDLATAPSGDFVVIDAQTPPAVRTFTADSTHASRRRIVAHQNGDLYELIPTDTSLGVFFVPIDEDGSSPTRVGPYVLSVPPKLDRRSIGVPEYGGRLSWSVDRATLDVTMKPGWDRQYSFPGGHNVVFGADAIQVAQRNIYLWLGVDGWRGGAGGELLLELDAQGNVASLERVATPRGSYAEVHRPFYVASNGTIYQWFPAATHAELRVRP